MAKWTVNGRMYEIAEPEKITTPRLCVFQESVSRNIGKMKAIFETAFPATGFSRLCVHVKTHKSPDITKMQMDAGITSFKASLHEVDMLINAGVKKIFIAYPLLRADAARAAEWMKTHPEIHFLLQAGCEEHVQILANAALEADLIFPVLIDIDVGMHRTGTAPENIFEVYDSIQSFSSLRFAGLHGYDGHIHQKTSEERQKAASASMGTLKNILDSFRSKLIHVPRVIAAGSPSFSHDLSIIKSWDAEDTLFQLSPGTWIYWDSAYDSLIPGLFEMAALILAQVVETGGNRRITLNLGHKRWGADQGPVNCFSIPDARVVSFSEEHTVLEHDGSRRFKTGDYVLIAPRHVCSTVNLWEYFFMIAGNGGIISSQAPVSARNR